MWLCSSETDDFSVSALSRHAIRMSASPSSSAVASPDRIVLRRKPPHYNFSGSEILQQRKIAAFKRWVEQTWTAQLDAIEWFVTTFPPSLQERVRTFLKVPSARYLEGLEVELHHPEQNQGPEIENRRAKGYYERKHWRHCVHDTELNFNCQLQ